MIHFNTPWTDEEIEDALCMRGRGISYDIIAQRLGRSPRGVEAMVIRRERETRTNVPDHEGARHEEDAIGGSIRLRQNVEKLFRKWEDENGFQRGAGAILLPAAWTPDRVGNAA